MKNKLNKIVASAFLILGGFVSTNVSVQPQTLHAAPALETLDPNDAMLVYAKQHQGLSKQEIVDMMNRFYKRVQGQPGWLTVTTGGMTEAQMNSLYDISHGDHSADLLFNDIKGYEYLNDGVDKNGNYINGASTKVNGVSVGSSQGSSSQSSSTSKSWSWHKSAKGWWYGSNSKTYAKGWKKINNVWYWFNKSGYVNTHKGWEKCKHGWAYSLGANGYYTNTTKKIGNVTYYFDTNAYAHKK